MTTTSARRTTETRVDVDSDGYLHDVVDDALLDADVDANHPDDLRPCVPYLHVDRIMLHYYGTLWRLSSTGDLERMAVSQPIGAKAAARLNQLDSAFGSVKRRPGDMVERFETGDELLAHAKRQAKALWDWQGDEIQRCFSMAGCEAARYYEFDLGEFTRQSKNGAYQ